MSTYDERSNKASGHTGDGLFQPTSSRGGSTYSASGRDPDFDEFDEAVFSPSGPIERSTPHHSTDSGHGGATSKLPQPGDGGLDRDLAHTNEPNFAPDAGYGPEAGRGLDYDEDRPTPWHGGADFGLLILRLVVGGTFVGHGLQHLFGLFHGIGITGFGHFIATGGYKYTNIMSYVAGGTELAGGALLVLGLFTPLAAAGLLALMANVIVLKWRLGFFAPGYEFELVLASAAFALLFAGPGRVSLDRPTPWFRRPVLNGFIFLVIAAAAAVATELLLRTRP